MCQAPRAQSLVRLSESDRPSATSPQNCSERHCHKTPALRGRRDCHPKIRLLLRETLCFSDIPGFTTMDALGKGHRRENTSRFLSFGSK